VAESTARSAVPRIEDYRDRDYDPYTAALTLGGEGHVTDPYPRLRAMRQEAPLWPGDFREHFGVNPDLTTKHILHFTALGYREVQSILSDPTAFSNQAYATNLGVYFGRSVTVMDPPEHTRYRLLFQKAFLPSMLTAWSKEMVPEIIRRHIDPFSKRGRADLVQEFALLFPFTFIMELMGLPEQDRAVFQKLAFGQIFITFDPEHGMEAVNKLKDYLTELVHLRREQPTGDNDFVHALATAEIDGERLPDDVVIAFFRQLMTAGGDTSYHGFSNLLAALLTHPDQLDALRRDRKLIPQAIDEGLRWDGPNLFISRTPAREVTLAGVTMQPGDIIDVVIASANRDEKQYPDPDRFDIFRETRRHLAFGLGPHVCIGQHLARMEMTIALSGLLDRLPNLRLDPEATPPVIRGFTLRAPDSVPVVFG
jgi:cytochrome P450